MKKYYVSLLLIFCFIISFSSLAAEDQNRSECSSAAKDLGDDFLVDLPDDEDDDSGSGHGGAGGGHGSSHAKEQAKKEFENFVANAAGAVGHFFTGDWDKTVKNVFQLLDGAPADTVDYDKAIYEWLVHNGYGTDSFDYDAVQNMITEAYENFLNEKSFYIKVPSYSSPSKVPSLFLQGCDFNFKDFVSACQYFQKETGSTKYLVEFGNRGFELTFYDLSNCVFWLNDSSLDWNTLYNTFLPDGYYYSKGGMRGFNFNYVRFCDEDGHRIECKNGFYNKYWHTPTSFDIGGTSNSISLYNYEPGSCWSRNYWTVLINTEDKDIFLLKDIYSINKIQSGDGLVVPYDFSGYDMSALDMDKLVQSLRNSIQNAVNGYDALNGLDDILDSVLEEMEQNISDIKDALRDKDGTAWLRRIYMELGQNTEYTRLLFKVLMDDDDNPFLQTIANLLRSNTEVVTLLGSLINNALLDEENNPILPQIRQLSIRNSEIMVMLGQLLKDALTDEEGNSYVAQGVLAQIMNGTKLQKLVDAFCNDEHEMSFYDLLMDIDANLNKDEYALLVDKNNHITAGLSGSVTAVSHWYQTSNKIKSKFPFSIPYLFYDIVNALDVKPIKPEMKLDFSSILGSKTDSVTLDMAYLANNYTVADKFFEVFKKLFLVGYMVGLYFFSLKLYDVLKDF